MVKRHAQLFSVAAFASYGAFTVAASAFVSDAMRRGEAVSKIILAASALHAVRFPQSTATECGEVALSQVGRDIPESTAKQYLSHVKGAIGHARETGILPTVDANSATEKAVLGHVERFCKANTLRALYDAKRAPAKAKADADKATREAEAERAEADAREAFGVEGETALQVSRLLKAVKPWRDAAGMGDANARAVLTALAAAILADRETVWTATDAMQGEAEAPATAEAQAA